MGPTNDARQLHDVSVELSVAGYGVEDDYRQTHLYGLHAGHAPRVLDQTIGRRHKDRHVLAPAEYPYILSMPEPSFESDFEFDVVPRHDDSVCAGLHSPPCGLTQVADTPCASHDESHESLRGQSQSHASLVTHRRRAELRRHWHPDHGGVASSVPGQLGRMARDDEMKVHLGG